jgi:DNA-binding NtrC family response regulator
MKPPASIMIVENNIEYCNTLRYAFEDRGYITWICPGPEMAETIFSEIHPNFVLLDLDLEDPNPLELIAAWSELAPHTRVIVGITIPDVRRLREAIDHGAYAFLIKSFSLAPLFDLLEKEIPPSTSLREISKREAA